MAKWIAAVILWVCLCAPNFAFAAADQGKSGGILDGDILGVSKEQALVVGAGILGGAVVLHLVVPGDLTYFAGGAIGGLAALWWYENSGDTKARPAVKPERASAAVTARAIPVVAGLDLAR